MTSPQLRVVATARAPQAIGPYSQAVVAGGLVFCAGQVGLDPATGELVGEDVAAQTRQALANLGEVLAAAGAGRERVAKTTLYLADLADFNTVNGIYEEFFGTWRPARSTLQAARLPRGARLEIDAVAVLSGGAG